MKKVLIIYKYLPQYRIDFFQQLKTRLKIHNIELYLIHGKSNKINSLKKDEETIGWATIIKNIELKAGAKSLIWQPCLKNLKDKDLIITLPENKLLLNYYLMIGRNFSNYKFAYWGHVYNMQNDLNNIRNKGKLLFIKKCDWWFAYTEGARNFLINSKFAANKITVVQNAISTFDIRKSYSEIKEYQIKNIKEKLDINSSNIAIYCGAMYPEKDFDFILETCYRIKKEIPDFHMLFVGSGIESSKIENAAAKTEWIHYIGSKFGEDRIIYFKISLLQLMPRAVGLAIVDSFAMETPIVTTEYPYHGPEIDYLENGVNGLITKNDINIYSDAVIQLLQNQSYLQLIDGCNISAEKYTVENMVENFKNGILDCLSC